MLNKLKKKIENNNFTNFTNTAIKQDELTVSADKFAGYNTIEELVAISAMINENIYSVEYLNNNLIKIKIK